jgi:hypothetical protein
MNYPEVKNPKKLGLYDYPKDYNFFDGPAVLPHKVYRGEPALQRLNGLLGARKKFRLWVLVWKNKPIDVSFKQEAYWKRGNKNELVVNIGVNNQGKAQWVRCFSWTYKTTLLSHINRYIKSQDKLDLYAFADWLSPEVIKNWEKRSFKEFDYISVDPPTWAVIGIFILVAVISVVVVYWGYENNVTSDGVENRRKDWYDFR